MTRAFDLALHRAKHMSRPRPPSITIGIDFSQSSMPMAGGGGLSSIQKRMNIGGEPHRLSYINSDEASLLKQLGGLGQPVRGTRGVPAYIGVGDEEGISEDYGVEGSMGGGVDMGEMGSSESYTGIGKHAGEFEDVAVHTKAAQDMRDALALQMAAPPDPTAPEGGYWGVPTKSEGIMGWLANQLASGVGATLGGLFGPAGALAGAKFGPDVMNSIISAIKSPSFTPHDIFGTDMSKSLGIDDPDDTPTEEDEEKKKIIAEEEKKEEKKLRGMAAYFAKMGGVSPLGYTDSEIELFKRIYPPDHPIWEDINREREPMWPSIEEETAVV